MKIKKQTKIAKKTKPVVEGGVMKKKKKLIKKKKPVAKEVAVEPVEQDEEEEEAPVSENEHELVSLDDEEEDELISSSKHKAGLEQLKKSDPDFFKFMQQEDPDLLEFQESDESENEEDEEEEEEDEPASRIPKAKKDNNGRLIFDGNLYSYLQDVLDPEDEKKASFTRIEDIRLAVDAFQACVTRVGADVEVPKYVINEQSLFEATIRLCFQSLGDRLRKVIKTSEVKSEDGSTASVSHKSKSFKRYKPLLKQYLHGLILFLNEVQTPVVITSTLKAIHRLLDLFADFQKLTRILIKALVRVWTRKTLDCRIMAYISMNELMKSHTQHFSYMYKAAYLGFVSNSREVSGETWPLLQFMHRTFAELTLLAPDTAYPYAFVYIRQTAIHLRNAMISKKRKDLVQAIYNWQLMQCLYLWVRVVSKAHSVNGAEAICELAYPLTQIIIGVSRLYPSPRFLPLRFHCVSLLIQLQANCTTYIPTLSLACELLDELAGILKKKPKVSKLAAKVTDLECHLKASSQQMEEPGWRSVVCENMFRIILQAAHSMCSQPAFPDMALPVIYKLRAFVKSIRSPDHARLFRGLIEKLESHSKMVADTLLIKEIELADEMSVRGAKFALNDPDSPLRTFYRQWEKVWKMKREAALKAENGTEKKPAAAAATTKQKKQKETPKEQVEVLLEAKKRTPKPKHKIGPAATHADATVPDQMTDLQDWLDE